MGVVRSVEASVESVSKGRLRGQMIARARVRGGGEMEFDLIEGVLSLGEGDSIRVEFLDSEPEDPEAYEFCGHGYLVAPEGEAGLTIFSIWGIIFKVKPPMGLEPERKYYLCLRRA